MGVARVRQPVSVAAGQALELRAGGPVEVATTVQSRDGSVYAETALRTAAGHSISGALGPGEHMGLTEVIGPEGAVLVSGWAGFG